MNSLDKLRSKIPPTNTDYIEGKWFKIIMQPNLLTEETLNIGVGFIDQKGSTHTRILDNLKRLECLFGESIDLENIRFLFNAVRQQLQKNPDSIHQLSNNIDISEYHYASGESAEEIIEDLYARMVTLEPEDDQKTNDDIESYSTEEIRNRVFNKVIEKDAFAKNIIQTDPTWVVGENRQALDMPIRGPGCYGNVISLWYRTKPSMELTTLRAGMDLETAHHISKKDKSGLFIARPPQNQQGYPEKIQRNIDEIIDQVRWQLKMTGTTTEFADSEEELADKIIWWRKK